MAALAIAGVLLSGGLWMTSGAPPQATAAPPAENLTIQQWLSGREALQIKLNNTLVEARQLAAPSARTTSICQKLARVSQQLLHGGRAPHPHLDTAANVGIMQFTQAAQACLAGDFPQMRRQIDDGTTLRAEAQDTLDQLLHGEHNDH
ncbi:hypothetical protein JOF56_003864 [Kibdelosporangium banguiense]|uniref:DUF732 domain-containing protein n=1 Tax=Kibdelosporangium banguiense TaxID=1365924 RepID=A0ABS4TGH4_9PSEU|nr:hypothetical protein [Kibdelosporangium banguiense]MBP2323479.1 hypothetical protein [Kibdelosporangium banguiense]